MFAVIASSYAWFGTDASAADVRQREIALRLTAAVALPVPSEHNAVHTRVLPPGARVRVVNPKNGQAVSAIVAAGAADAGPPLTLSPDLATRLSLPPGEHEVEIVALNREGSEPKD